MEWEAKELSTRELKKQLLVWFRCSEVKRHGTGGNCHVCGVGNSCSDDDVLSLEKLDLQ